MPGTEANTLPRPEPLQAPTSTPAVPSQACFAGHACALLRFRGRECAKANSEESLKSEGGTFLPRIPSNPLVARTLEFSPSASMCVTNDMTPRILIADDRIVLFTDGLTEARDDATLMILAADQG